jgi:hypothetical protein
MPEGLGVSLLSAVTRLRQNAGRSFIQTTHHLDNQSLNSLIFERLT